MDKPVTDRDALRQPLNQAALRAELIGTGLGWRQLDVVEQTGSTNADLLAREGAVHPRVAAQMADGVRRRLGATWGLATTGVAGPDAQDGRTPGTVYLGVAGPSGVRSVGLLIAGDRAAVRRGTVDAALGVLLG